MSTRLRGAKRKRTGKVKVPRAMAARRREGRLAEMTVDEFLEKGLSSSSENESDLEEDKEIKKTTTKYKQSKKRLSSSITEEQPAGKLSHRLAEIDPDFFEFLQENDSELLQMSESDTDFHLRGNDRDDLSVESSDDDVIENVEPRPLHITSRKIKEPVACDSVGGDSESAEGEDVSVDVVAGKRGERVTKEMIQGWVNSATGKSPAVDSLRSLSNALHDAINDVLVESASEGRQYFIDDPSLFNSLVVACIKSIPHCLSHQLPRTPSTARHSKAPPPSSLKGWGKVKTTIKVYLSDLLRLLDTLKESSMRCAILKHIQSLSEYYICFPKVVKRLQKLLVSCWSEGESHVKVLAFVVLRRITLLQPHPALHHLLKKLYLAFVSNCKFTSSSTLPQIRFMQNCLVELLSIDPPTSYQHAFVYIRQLAVHLRTALTSGKKQAVLAVYNWQFVHCVDLWSHMLSHVTNDSVRPLVYPLVQLMLGALHLQPSARYYPLRLHVVRSLLELSAATHTFVPVAPYLLEIFESHGVGGAGHVTSGKPPNMSILLHASKQQLLSNAFRNSLLNESYELMLRYFAIYSPTIGFPELAYPSLVRLRKVCKSVQFSWLRLHLKQLIEKVEAVGSEVTKLRAGVEFSPKDHQLVAAWERERRDRGNVITNLLATWNKVQAQTQQRTLEDVEEKDRVVEGESADLSSSDNQAESAESADEDAVDSDGEDIIEDFNLSSNDSESD